MQNVNVIASLNRVGAWQSAIVDAVRFASLTWEWSRLLSATGGLIAMTLCVIFAFCNVVLIFDFLVGKWNWRIY